MENALSTKNQHHPAGVSVAQGMGLRMAASGSSGEVISLNCWEKFMWEQTSSKVSARSHVKASSYVQRQEKGLVYRTIEIVLHRKTNSQRAYRIFTKGTVYEHMVMEGGCDQCPSMGKRKRSQNTEMWCVVCALYEWASLLVILKRNISEMLSIM